MNRSETAQIIAIMQLNYSDTFKSMSDQTLLGMVDLWQRMFAEEPAALVQAAVEAHIRTSTDRFMPNIGVIKEEIRKLTVPEQMSEAEAWTRIKKALSNGLYGAEEEYAKLPPVLQRLVGSPSRLREWAQMDADTVESVIGSNIQRSYRAISAQEAEWAKLPAGYREHMRQLSGQIFGRLELEGGDHEGT